MPRTTIKKPMTQCGMYGNRARVVARAGNQLTYLWPCGYERTEVFMQGPGRLRKPAPPDVVAFFSRYWEQGVTYECPRCRRKALEVRRKGARNG